MTDEPRFYVSSITGYGLVGPGSRLHTSYAVLDSCYSHREVFVANVGGSLYRDADRRRACEREAARRNALDAAGCAA